ncbi:MAG: aa3-type cytochrome c oxidase subunit IV [Candidatus Sphingomonas colombiensis]|nr:aa3-type cytochrome c oxidase subunit IV [Sphingomonas sp.]WEK44730.1 MAG: aa3-type cytochrome c oxidase subunit IV [Sphingomonas sp.]
MAEKSEMKAHVATYQSVMGLLKWGSVGVALIAALVIWLIHR